MSTAIQKPAHKVLVWKVGPSFDGEQTGDVEIQPGGGRGLPDVPSVAISPLPQGRFRVGDRVRESETPERGGIIVALVYDSYLVKKSAELVPDTDPRYLVRWDRHEEGESFVRRLNLCLFDEDGLSLEREIPVCPACGSPAVTDSPNGQGCHECSWWRGARYEYE